MTYRELKRFLDNLDPARLNDQVTIEFDEGEFYPAETAYIIDGSDVLEDGHLVITALRD